VRGPSICKTPSKFKITPYNLLLKTLYLKKRGHDIAQAVIRRFPTAATRVRARVWSCGICGEQSGTGAGFLRVLWFPVPIRIPSIAPVIIIIIIWGWYNRPVVAALPSGLTPWGKKTNKNHFNDERCKAINLPPR
jgi:hypothetical protein